MLNFSITFSKFPMPPSSNKLYSAVRGRLIKSADARKFDSSVDFWALTRKQTLEREKRRLEAIRANGDGFKCFKVSCIFVFHKSRLIGKKGQLKRLDHTNRIKQTHDAFARIMGLDDCLFVDTPTEKVTCDSIKDEQVIITIEPTTMRKFEDL